MPTKSTKKRVCCKLCLLQGKYIDDCIKDQNNFSIHLLKTHDKRSSVDGKRTNYYYKIKKAKAETHYEYEPVIPQMELFANPLLRQRYKEAMKKPTPKMSSASLLKQTQEELKARDQNDMSNDGSLSYNALDSTVEIKSSCPPQRLTASDQL
eukprot:472425_1